MVSTTQQKGKAQAEFTVLYKVEEIFLPQLLLIVPKESINVAFGECSQSKKVKIWFKWCFLRRSDKDSFLVFGIKVNWARPMKPTLIIRL